MNNLIQKTVKKTAICSILMLLGFTSKAQYNCDVTIFNNHSCGSAIVNVYYYDTPTTTCAVTTYTIPFSGPTFISCPGTCTGSMSDIIFEVVSINGAGLPTGNDKVSANHTSESGNFTSGCTGNNSFNLQWNNASLYTELYINP